VCMMCGASSAFEPNHFESAAFMTGQVSTLGGTGQCAKWAELGPVREPDERSQNFSGLPMQEGNLRNVAYRP